MVPFIEAVMERGESIHGGGLWAHKGEQQEGPIQPLPVVGNDQPETAPSSGPKPLMESHEHTVEKKLVALVIAKVGLPGFEPESTAPKAASIPS